MQSRRNKKRMLYYGAAAIAVALIAGYMLAHSKQSPQTHLVTDNPVIREYRAKLSTLKAQAEQKPNDASVRSAYAQALYVTGDKQAARKEYEAALGLDPKNASMRNSLGNVDRDLADYEAAAQNYRQAYALDPSFINAYVNLATMQMYTLKKPADAVATYKLAVSKNGQSAELLLLLGGAYEQNHQSDLALATYRTVLDKDPNNTVASQNIARLSKH